MPDAHWGYGFPIGGVAAFDPAGGVVSAGGVGFDISCGVRMLHTGLTREDVEPVKKELADTLFRRSRRRRQHGRDPPRRRRDGRHARGGARWAVGRGYGRPADLERIEEHGRMRAPSRASVSEQAKKRQRDEMGTLGSGNHYLEVQHVVEVFDRERSPRLSACMQGDIVVSIHCGSRGLGHQIGTEFLSEMAHGGHRHGSCCPIASWPAHRSIRASASAIWARCGGDQLRAGQPPDPHASDAAGLCAKSCPRRSLPLLYDVSHNTCKVEEHVVDGGTRQLVRASQGRHARLRPGHPDLPRRFAQVGQPVLIGGTMGTGSYIWPARQRARACLQLGLPRRGPSMSRHQALTPMAAAAASSTTGRARHPDPQPLHARRGGGGARRLQGCQRGSRRGG